MHGHGCATIREALSARLDGEALPDGVDDAIVGAHLTRCADCAAHARAVADQHRSLRVRPAEAVPDLTSSIMAATAPLHPQPVREWARYALLAVAATQLLLALPVLLFGKDVQASVHIARELGTFDVAVAVGLLWAAWQPSRAKGLLPLATALAGGLVLTALLDMVGRDAPVLSETHHLLDLAGLALLWALAHPPRPATRPSTGTALAA